MALYLKTQKIDVETGDPAVVLINTQDAQKAGLFAGDIVWLNLDVTPLTALVNTTDTEIEPGYIGLYAEIWDRYRIESNYQISIDLITRPRSVDFIAQKITGHVLNQAEIDEIISDISDQRMKESEMVYFMATMFNPGFNDDETLCAIHAMAKYGDNLNFKGLGNRGGCVVDKHSIGGIASKGVTPILVPLVATFGLNIPNTSTRAITSPAGTSDILETVMPVQLSKEEIYKVVEKTGACMIWGGGLKLAPAADVLIKAEKDLHLEAFQKLMISIVAKKVAMGVTHVLIDIPYGENTKVHHKEDAYKLASDFVKFFELVGIKCSIFLRDVKTPDGYGVGPNLEARDVLRILERKRNRPKDLEELALDMVSRLLESCTTLDRATAKEEARKKLDSGEALHKFWQIAFAQGAKKMIKSEDLTVGHFTFDVISPVDGVIEGISNKDVVVVAQALGTPYIKESGIYLYKTRKDVVKKGEKLCTLYAPSNDRLKHAIMKLNVEKFFDIRPTA